MILSFSGDNDRDVFNEKPSKEELISATQVCGSVTFMFTYVSVLVIKLFNWGHSAVIVFGIVCHSVLSLVRLVFCKDHTHTHTFNGPFSGTTQVSRYLKGKPIWILLKQETVSGSGISWAICMSAPYSRQTTTPVPHHCFLQAGCPSCHPANSVKALKAFCKDH